MPAKGTIVTPKIAVVCAVCGTSFQEYPREIKRGRRFCSRACRYAGLRRPAAERFWRLVGVVGPNDCWLWKGAQASGYGHFYFEGRKQTAHRVAWQLVNGPIPDGMLVCHNCPEEDCRLCCNLAHLFLGTPADNMRDMKNKGRAPFGNRNGSRRHPERIERGEARHSAKLTEADVRAIRARYAAGGTTLQELADEYGVAFSNISMIVRRQAWKHVP